MTNALYCAFLNAGGSDDHWHNEMSGEIARAGSAAPYSYTVAGGFAQRPVHWATWFDATDFCAWRSTAEGLPAGAYRLPTEAEWEKAAGWGDPARTSLWTYAFQSDSIDATRANYDRNVNTTTEVGSYAAWKSWYGCYDMSGNVWEWCSDWYGGTYPSSPSNPTGPTTGASRVMRGGSYFDDATPCRVDFRFANTPSGVGWFSGFRSARTAP